MGILGAFIIFVGLIFGPIIACDSLTQNRKEQHRYQCVQDGHSVKDCEALFP